MSSVSKKHFSVKNLYINLHSCMHLHLFSTNLRNAVSASNTYTFSRSQINVLLRFRGITELQWTVFWVILRTIKLISILPYWKHAQIHRCVHILPESFISSSEATLTLISWLSKLFLAVGLPSLGFRGPGRSAPAVAPVGPSWQNVTGKLDWTWLWDWEAGLGLNASSTLGSSFKWNGDFNVSLWLAAAERKTEKIKGMRRNWEKERIGVCVCGRLVRFVGYFERWRLH